MVDEQSGSRVWRWVRRVMLGLAGLLALIVAGFFVMFWFGGNDVEKFCGAVKSGTPVAELPALAKQHGVQIILPGISDKPGTFLALARTP